LRRELPLRLAQVDVDAAFAVKVLDERLLAAALARLADGNLGGEVEARRCP
jgi:hypothetical protein